MRFCDTTSRSGGHHGEPGGIERAEKREANSHGEEAETLVQPSAGYAAALAVCAAAYRRVRCVVVVRGAYGALVWTTFHFFFPLYTVNGPKEAPTALREVKIDEPK